MLPNKLDYRGYIVYSSEGKLPARRRLLSTLRKQRREIVSCSPALNRAMQSRGSGEQGNHRLIVRLPFFQETVVPHRSDFSIPGQAGQMNSCNIYFFSSRKIFSILRPRANSSTSLSRYLTCRVSGYSISSIRYPQITPFISFALGCSFA